MGLGMGEQDVGKDMDQKGLLGFPNLQRGSYQSRIGRDFGPKCVITKQHCGFDRLRYRITLVIAEGILQ